jgi:hypothetical protein
MAVRDSASGQVRAGGRDASTSTRAKGDGARQGVWRDDLWLAWWIGCSLSIFVAWTFDFVTSKRLTHSKLLEATALKSGVCLSQSVTATSALARIRDSTLARLALAAAQWSGVLPQTSWKFNCERNLGFRNISSRSRWSMPSTVLCKSESSSPSRHRDSGNKVLSCCTP